MGILDKFFPRSTDSFAALEGHDKEGSRKTEDEDHGYDTEGGSDDGSDDGSSLGRGRGGVDRFDEVFTLAGTIGLPPAEIWPLTLRQFLKYLNAYLLSTWDHTASTNFHLNALRCTVHNITGKHKMTPLTFAQCHPFRRATAQRGLKINVDNFDRLKQFAGAMTR